MFEFLFKLNEQLFVIWNVAAAVSLQFISAALTSLVQSLIRVKGHRGMHEQENVGRRQDKEQKQREELGRLNKEKNWQWLWLRW